MIAVAVTAAALASSGQPAKQEVRNARHEEIKAYLARIRNTQGETMNIDVAEGERLFRLVRKLKAKRVLEIGTSNGHSTIWIAMGLEETGGRIISIEFHEGRHNLAVENFAKLGLDHLADLRFADALKEVPRVEAPSTWCSSMLGKRITPPTSTWSFRKFAGRSHRRPRHHVVREGHGGFLEADQIDQGLKTEFLSLGPNGMSISVKE